MLNFLKRLFQGNVKPSTGIICPYCEGQHVVLTPPVTVHATFGRFCLDCKYSWEVSTGTPTKNNFGEIIITDDDIGDI